MDYRDLDQAEYDRKLRMVIVDSEGLHAHVRDGGCTFNRDNNVATCPKFGKGRYDSLHG
jgi:hypothetical protein